MNDWRDDPDVKAAMARASELTSAWMAGQEDTIRARGFPVSVAYGDPEDDEQMAKVTRLTATARAHGSTEHVGGNDATTYLFPTLDACAAFTADVLGFADRWWRITPTATPRYGP